MDRSIWRGTVILTIAAIVIKILSAVYRLPYQNLAGDVGFYVYQQVYPFYALAVTMGGFGFPVVISKMMSEARVKNGHKGIQTVFSTATGLLTVLGVFLFLIVFIGAPSIAWVMEDPLLIRPLHIISFIFLWMPFLAVLRGYFQGEQWNMKPTGVSQVGEQTLRVSLILGLSFWFFYQGEDPYTFGSGAAFGSMIAPLASVLILIFFFVKNKSQFRPQVKRGWNRALAKRLISEGFAYTATSLALVIFQFVDTLTLVPLLNDHVEASRALKGIYDRSFPFIQMGLMVAVALATSSVPVFAQLKQVKEDIHQYLKQPLRLVIILGSAAAFGLIFIIKETNIFLFEDSLGSATLAIMALNILSASIVITGATLLQGLTNVWLPVIYMILMAGVKLILNMLLIPHMGIMGAGLATVVSLFGLAGLIIHKLKKISHLRMFELKEYALLACSLLMMFVVVTLWKLLANVAIFHYSHARIESGILALTSVGGGAIVFLVLIIKMRLLAKEDMLQLPGGKYLVKLLLKKA